MVAAYIVWIALLAYLWNNCDCACTFPTTLTGDFQSSLDNTQPITFTSNTVTGFTFTQLSNTYRLTYECQSQSGNNYLIRSDTTQNIVIDVWIYRCLEIIQVTDDIYYFHYTMPYLEDAKEYIKHSIDASLTSSECTRSPSGIDAVPYILVKSSAVSTAKTFCPNVFLAKYAYTAVNTNTNAEDCTDADMNSCEDKTVAAFNKTSCGTDLSYSANGDLHCGINIVKSGVTYMYTINPEGSVNYGTTQRFLCFALKQSGSTVIGTLAKGVCVANQTETTEGDYTLTFTPNTYTCPITDDTGGSGFPVAIIAAVIAVLVLLVIGGVAGYCIYKKRKRNKVTVTDEKKESPRDEPDDGKKPEKEKESNNTSHANGDVKPKEKTAEPNGDVKPKDADKAS